MGPRTQCAAEGLAKLCSAELVGGRKERQFVVRLAKSLEQHTYDAPKYLVREFLI